MKASLSAKRPFLLYVLVILFILAGAICLIGTIGIFQAWNWWLSFTTLAPIISHVFQGILYNLVWISSAVILWLRLPWAVLYCRLSVMIMTFWFWFERIFLTENPLPFSRHALSLVITFIFLIFVFSCLYLVAPSMKPFPSSPKVGGITSIQTTGEKK